MENELAILEQWVYAWNECITISKARFVEFVETKNNLANTSLITDIVMPWLLVIEEYGPESMYIEGKKSVVADSLLCLETE